MTAPVKDERCTYRPLEHVAVRCGGDARDQLTGLGPPRQNIVNGGCPMLLVVVGGASSGSRLGAVKATGVAVNQACLI